MQTGDRFKLQIERCAFGGDGLGRHDGLAVFVPGALPGERVIVEVTKAGRDFLRARVLEWGEVSPHRIACDPKAAEKYPECAYLYTTYAYETELKEGQLRDFLRPFAPALAPLPSIAPAPEVGYRNKLVLHVNKESGRPEIGYIGADKQTVTPVTHCPLARPEINEFLREFLAAPGSAHSVHHRMQLTFRFTEPDGVKFYRNNAPRNSSWLKEQTAIGLVSVPLDGFFQVNSGGVDALLGELGRIIDREQPDRLLDLYCGAGLFAAAAAAKGVPQIAGVEQDASSVAAARYNLAQRGRDDARFLAGDAARCLPELLENGGRPLLLVDPPRQGLAAGMLNSLGALPAGAGLVYISCHPATWARDARRLEQRGCRLEEVRLVNQFGRTAHFELFSFFRKDS